MSYLAQALGLPLLLAGLIGLMVGWMTCTTDPRGRFGGWFPIGVAAFVIGLAALALGVLGGRAALALEMALALAAAYVGGCCVGCLLRRMILGNEALVGAAAGAAAIPAGHGTLARTTVADVPPAAARLKVVASRDADGPAESSGPYADKMREWARSGDPEDKDAPLLQGPYANKRKASDEPAPKPTSDAATAATATGVAAAVTATAAKVTTSPAAVSKPAAEPMAAPAGPIPPRLAAPRDGKADDLTLIWGVGEKLAGRMNRMGIWHFDQIAAWTPRHVDWFEGEIQGFKGRIERDKWIEQCTKLATGWRPDNEAGDRLHGAFDDGKGKKT